jgi:hypothetical protein
MSRNKHGFVRVELPQHEKETTAAKKKIKELKPFYWEQYAANVTDDKVKELAQWRGYSPEFVQWLRCEKLVGLYGNNWAFPVSNNGTTIGLHYRIEDKASEEVKWIYFPTGNGAQLFVLGKLGTANTAHCFESQWDMFTMADQTRFYQVLQETGVALMSSRSAANARLLDQIPRSVETIYLWPQNDPPKDDGRPTGSEIWLAGAIEALVGRNLRIVRTSADHKDLNDWVRDGGARQEDLDYTIEHAEALQPQAEPDKEQPKREYSFNATYEPWDEPVDAEGLLEQIIDRIKKEVIVEEHQYLVAGIWTMFTWVHPQMEFSPRLYITAPTSECGKTSFLEVIAKMVRRPLTSDNISPASIFRLCENYHPTFCLDEAHDQLENPDFWLVVKSGHTPDHPAIRCEPKSFEPQIFDVFAPKLLAGIGRANAQIMSRSIVIEMERNDGKVDRSTRASDPVFVDIRRKLERWSIDCGDLRTIHLPDDAAVKRRARDNWESLYRVARAISDETAEQLLACATEFGDEQEDYATYLLESLRKLYKERDKLKKEGGFLGSTTIVEELNKDKQAPWYAKSDKGLTPHGLASRLRRYKVKPDQVRINDEIVVRGYNYVDTRKNHNDLERVFKKYLAPLDEK